MQTSLQLQPLGIFAKKNDVKQNNKYCYVVKVGNPMKNIYAIK